MAKVLLVGNDRVAGVNLMRSFLRHGHLAHSVNDCQAALDCIDYVIPDCIILDCRMELAKGMETLKQIRNRKKAADVPVVAFMMNPENNAQALASGFSEVWPCAGLEYDAIVERTSNLLNRRRAA